MRRVLTSLAVVAMTVSLAPAADRAADGDLKKLQGKWSAKGGLADSSTVTLTLDGETIRFVVPAPNGEDVTISGNFTIDETADPKTITWSGMKAKDRDLPDVQGIYAFDGDDTLKIAGGNGKDRPKAFIEKGKETEGQRPNTMVFTRVKDEPKE